MLQFELDFSLHNRRIQDPNGQSDEKCVGNHISKFQHDPTVDKFPIGTERLRVEVFGNPKEEDDVSLFSFSQLPKTNEVTDTLPSIHMLHNILHVNE